MPSTVVLLDADTVAGWRRAQPSLAQLHSAAADLRRAHPDVVVTVVADPSIKWALDASEHDAFEQAIVDRAVVCAPAGTIGGTNAWIAAVAGAVSRAGGRPLVVTDRAVGGVPVVRLGHAGSTFTFDLDGAKEVEGRSSPVHRRRTGRG